MIYVGLTGWSDHPDVYSTATSSTSQLFDYAGHFPIVEIDTSFYAIPSMKSVQKWLAETPAHFQFIIKGYQGMTGHMRGDNPYFETKKEMFEAFRKAVEPFQRAGKLASILMQFPPWFDCQFANVQYIRYVRQQLEGLPVAIEFRNRSWYSEKYFDGTINLLKEHQLIHTVCDEPQAGEGSVPLVPVATEGNAFVRIHGRNVQAWNSNGRNSEEWRKIRFLYDYTIDELKELAQHIRKLQQTCQNVFVVFNNNSGHDAARNAKQLLALLGITYDNLAPKQLGLFEEE